MTGGEAYRAKLLTDDALDAAIAACLADVSQPAMLEIGDKRLDVAAAVLANAYSTEVLRSRRAARRLDERAGR
ncbi:hypothetical protein LRS73_16595 [Methylobacterium currus]|uniref:hypothetical protein n=1 Tax=Methylobacterium currus TaxID=2051553 RepID=UPI001E29AC1B|nr:hypothetical protein [Methylobacterium currus]UHC14195.1 hypothetical protein LRS73_16595 [Methylobacterium currus]